MFHSGATLLGSLHVPFCCNVIGLTTCSILVQRYWAHYMFHSGASLLGSQHVPFWCNVIELTTCSILLQRYWDHNMFHSGAVLLGWLHVPFCCNVIGLIVCCILLQCYWDDCMLHSVATLLGWLYVAFCCCVIGLIACCILLQCYWADCMLHDLCLFDIFCAPVLHSCMFVLLYRNRLLQIKVEICWESLWVVFLTLMVGACLWLFSSFFLTLIEICQARTPYHLPPPPPAPPPSPPAPPPPAPVPPPFPMHSQNKQKRSLDSMFNSEADVAEWLNWHPDVHRLVFGTAGLGFSPGWTQVHRCALFE